MDATAPVYPENVSVLEGVPLRVIAMATAECDDLSESDWGALRSAERELTWRVARRGLGTVRETIEPMRHGMMFGIMREDPDGPPLPLPHTSQDPLVPPVVYPPSGRRPALVCEAEDVETASALMMGILSGYCPSLEWEVHVVGYPAGTRVPVFVDVE